MNNNLDNIKNKINESNLISQSIGTKQEKTLHQIMKYYLTMDETEHEVRVDKMYVDVKIKENIYEVQTQSFDKLRHKLETLLPNHFVTIVFPIPYIKFIYLIDENGQLQSHRRSPKKGSPFHIFVELYKIKPYLKDPHLSLKIIMLNTKEYRNIVPKRHSRSKGYIRDDQDVIEIIQEYNIIQADDFKTMLDEVNLPPIFTSYDLRKKLQLSLKESGLTLNILFYLGVIKKVGIKNRYIQYQIV